MRRLIPILFLMVISVGSMAAGVEPHNFDGDREREGVYKDLIEELRCLVCQNQNLADSNAELAQDLRRQTYELVREGKSKAEIKDYMTSRYGDFVLYKPPFQISTALLWIGPFIILAVGVFSLVGFIRGRSREQAPEITQADHQRAEALLNKVKDQNKDSEKS
ncbi:MAG: cytochrome c-type biogenesis protein CcmH [Gammaproteobacteria bacterium]|nr:cytochrome c-type biogenesis protein CcmH [Gammaproteobacteria bacterium]